MVTAILERLIFGLPCIIIALTVHEFFHAYVAFRCGDPSAKYEKRLTLNPVAHIDPIGGLMLLISLLVTWPLVLGWAKPVPVSEQYLGNPRRDVFLVSLAGPLSNFGMAVLAAIILRAGFIPDIPLIGGMMDFFIRINLCLGLFNLIPCPPLDGWKILGALMPTDISYKMKSFEQKPYVSQILMLVIIFSPIAPILVGVPYAMLYGLLTGRGF